MQPLSSTCFAYVFLYFTHISFMSYVMLVHPFIMMTCFTFTIFSNVQQNTLSIKIHTKRKHSLKAISEPVIFKPSQNALE